MTAAVDAPADPAVSTDETSAAETGRPSPLRNSTLLSLAALGAKACGFLLFLVALPHLGKVGFGSYNVVLAFVGLFAVLTDPGLTTLVVRDASANRSLLPQYASHLLTLRLALAVAVAAVCIGVSFVPGLLQGPYLQKGVLIWAFALIPMALTGVATTLFQAVERLTVVSILTAVAAASTALLGITALLLGADPVMLLVVSAAANTGVAVAALLLVRRIVVLRPRLDAATQFALLRTAAPFAALTLLNVLYSRADTVLVDHFKGTDAAGLYGVAYRLVDTLLVVVIAPFNAAALPAFSRIAARSRADLQTTVLSGLRISVAVGAPLAVAATAYARDALLFAGRSKDFTDATAALQWLAWSFPCFTVLAIFYNALYAVDRGKALVTIFGVTLLFNVSLNLVFIPLYSFNAAAALTTLSELLNVLLAGLFVARHVVNPLRAWLALLKVVGGAAVMAVVLWALRLIGPVAGSPFVALPLASVSYLAALRLLRTFGPRERAALRRLPVLGRWARWL